MRTDAELISGMARQEAEALAELYDRYRGRLTALCRRMLGNVSDAEEVLQETFIQAWQQASHYDHDRSPAGAWLVMLARSRAFDRLRTSRRQIAHAAVEGGLDACPAGGSGPERAVLEREAAVRVRLRVSHLDAAERTTLELAFFEGMTHADIAKLLHQPLGTVKTRIRLALIRLRETLHAPLPPPVREPSPLTVALSRYLAARAAAALAPLPDLKGLTVLVVDNDRDTLGLTKTVLESAGAHVVAQCSPVCALAYVRDAERWPDIMLADLVMPELDGYALVEQVQAVADRRRSPLPVVAFSAHVHVEPAARAARIKFAGYLAKPASPRRVVETVAQLCGRVA